MGRGASASTTERHYNAARYTFYLNQKKLAASAVWTKHNFNYISINFAGANFIHSLFVLIHPLSCVYIY